MEFRITQADPGRIASGASTSNLPVVGFGRTDTVGYDALGVLIPAD